jgi:hypothetical protein
MLQFARYRTQNTNYLPWRCAGHTVKTAVGLSVMNRSCLRMRWEFPLHPVTLGDRPAKWFTTMGWSQTRTAHHVTRQTFPWQPVTLCWYAMSAVSVFCMYWSSLLERCAVFCVFLLFFWDPFAFVLCLIPSAKNRLFEIINRFSRSWWIRWYPVRKMTKVEKGELSLYTP